MRIVLPMRGNYVLKIIFATTNEGKLLEARRVLTPLGYEVIGKPVRIVEPDEGTVEEIAMNKLEQALEQLQGNSVIMVDDAGIFFHAYPQFPGVLTKRIFERIGYRGIRKLLIDEPRSAWFEGTIAVYWHGEKKIFSGTTLGKVAEYITDDLIPEPGFPYDPIFIPEGETNVLSQLPIEKRLFYSYRRKALEKMAEWVRSIEKTVNKK